MEHKQTTQCENNEKTIKYLYSYIYSSGLSFGVSCCLDLIVTSKYKQSARVGANEKCKHKYVLCLTTICR